MSESEKKTDDKEQVVSMMMIDRELDECVVYQVHYRLKNGKRMRCAYSGDSKEVCEQVVEELEQRGGVRYLSKTITMISVTLFD